MRAVGFRAFVPPLKLWDVDDASAFVWAIVRKGGRELDYHDAEDLHAYLLAECWRLSLRYVPGGVDFDGWAAKILRVRVVDWERQRSGRTRWQFADRTYERTRPTLVPLDDDSMGDAERAQSSDPETDCDSSLRRVLAGGSSTRARDYETLGLEPPRRATG
jgi:DNA-directed RNA polymerase specialized sigma24 family protein